MSDQDGSSFATAPVSPGGGRRPLVVGVVVLALVVGSFVLARLSPAPETGQTPDQAAASPTPAASASFQRATPTPTLEPVAVATPPPLREWFSAPAAPIDDVLLEDGTIRWFRLASARLTGEPLARPGNDLLLRPDRVGTICLCWQPSGTEAGDPRSLVLIRSNNDGSERSRTTVTTVNGVDITDRPNAPTQVALEPSPVARLVYLVRAVRSATAWQVGLDVIDLDTGAVVDSADLVSLPQIDRSVVLTVEPPTLRIAPDGRHLLVMAGTERLTSMGNVSSTRRAWIVALDGPHLGRISPTDPIADSAEDIPTRPCSWVAFASPTIVAKGCAYNDDFGFEAFEVRRYDLAGAELARVVMDPEQRDPERILLDQASGTAYIWDPIFHGLVAVDLVTGGWRTAGQPTDTQHDPDAVFRADVRPATAAGTLWTDGRSATALAVPRSLVGSADGTVLFAVGLDPAGGSSGVWIFDAHTLQLIERWPALAVYDSIALFENGRWLAALGRPGVTPQGGPADWGSTLTVHDTSTGLPVVRIGELAASAQVTLPWQAALFPAP